MAESGVAARTAGRLDHADGCADASPRAIRLTTGLSTCRNRPSGTGPAACSFPIRLGGESEGLGMSHDFIRAFHRLAFFRKAPITKLLGIVRGARGYITTADSLEALRQSLLALMPADDATRLVGEVDGQDDGQWDNPWHVMTVDEDAVGLFRAIEAVLDDPPPLEEWLATLDYLERAVRDVTRGGASG